MILYSRFACAAGVKDDSKEFHLGLYLLYLGITDLEIATNATYVQIACASLHLSLRMLKKMNTWPSYLKEISSLTLDDFYATARTIAKVFVNVINQEPEATENHKALLLKFKLEQHKAVAEYVPSRKSPAVCQNQ